MPQFPKKPEVTKLTNLNRFVYQGPVSSAIVPFSVEKTTVEGKETETPSDFRDVPLHPGQAVELPKDAQEVVNLIELGYLTEEKPEPAAPSPTQKEG